MTMQYLAGELSVRLAQVQAEGRDPSASAVGRLRHEAETLPPDELGTVVRRALALVDQLCWESLASGDVDAFAREAAMGADLAEFGECAGLLVGDETRQQEAP